MSGKKVPGRWSKPVKRIGVETLEANSPGVYSVHQSPLNKKTVLPQKPVFIIKLWASLKKVFENFCNQSSLHGLQFLVDYHQSHFVRLLWLLAIISSWSFGIFMIMLFWEKWKESPILVSFDDDLSPIWQIPFPAVTICNMNKILKSQVNKIDKLAKMYPNNDTYKIEKLLVDEICATSVAPDEKKEGNKTKRGNNKKKHKQILDGATFHHYLKELSVSCKDMVLRCHFGGIKYDCSHMFTDVVTDDGKCCAFNIMPDEVMFRHFPRNPTAEKNWKDWTPQDGYKNKPSQKNILFGEMPRRTSSPGLTMGLSVLLNVQENEYYCTGSESVGFKILLHSPVDHPEMVDFGFGLPPGSENFISLLPSYIHSNNDIHSLDYKVRQCFFEDEKSLMYFKHFTYLNCIIECITNQTFSMCGCVAYYMPRTDDIPICSPEKIDCIKKAKIKAEESNIQDDSDKSKVRECECLPSCTEINYPHEASMSKVQSTKMLKFTPEERNTFLKDGQDDDTYARNNLAVIHIFYKSLNILRQERSQLYGPIEFIANVGGILGLCGGSSLLSICEVFFYFVIQIGSYVFILLFLE
ncbi:pickpocket protein 28 [Lepeophtheirus salmonis]|uniref:pickpocket protein 28 n=1 Tax=Lepeophtheirus salmonis TaxID=72036 RepID=UPI003AF35D94